MKPALRSSAISFFPRPHFLDAMAGTSNSTRIEPLEQLFRVRDSGIARSTRKADG
jgi:hypothetical protein